MRKITDTHCIHFAHISLSRYCHLSVKKRNVGQSLCLRVDDRCSVTNKDRFVTAKRHLSCLCAMMVVFVVSKSLVSRVP